MSYSIENEVYTAKTVRTESYLRPNFEVAHWPGRPAKPLVRFQIL